jgi:hypothetical protein
MIEICHNLDIDVDVDATCGGCLWDVWERLGVWDGMS